MDTAQTTANGQYCASKSAGPTLATKRNNALDSMCVTVSQNILFLLECEKEQHAVLSADITSKQHNFSTAECKTKMAFAMRQESEEQSFSSVLSSDENEDVTRTEVAHSKEEGVHSGRREYLNYKGVCVGFQ